MDRPQATSSIQPFSLLQLGALFLATLLLLGLSMQVLSIFREVEHLRTVEIRLQQLIGEIVHLDEVLTMSARLAVATGEPYWEERYHQHEPKLTAVIEEAQRIVPDLMHEFIRETEVANLKLVEMETKSFEQLREKNIAGAISFLFTPEYEAQKELYAKGINKLRKVMADRLHEDIDKHESRLLLTLFAVLTTIGILFVLWVSNASMSRKRIKAERKTLKVMEQARDQLETRVREATLKLEQEVESKKAAQDFARKSEKDIQSILYYLPIGIVMVDPTDHIIKYVNKYAMEMIGLAEESIVGRECHNFICPAERGACPITDLGLEVDNSKKTLLDKDGYAIPVLKTVTSIELSGKRLLLGGFMDISELYETKKELEDISFNLKERLKELSCLYALAELAEKQDINIEDICQQVAEILPGAWFHSGAASARVIYKGQAYATENFRETKWIQVAPLKLAGTDSGTVEVAYLEELPKQDDGPFSKEERQLLDAVAERLGRILERIKIKKELDQHKMLLVEAQRIARIGAWNWDFASDRFDFSDEWLRIHGCEETNLSMSELMTLVHPADRDLVSETLRKTKEDKGEHALEYRIVRRDNGEVRTVFSRAKVLCDAADKSCRMFGSCLDITEEKELEAALREREELFRQLAVNIHEVFWLESLEEDGGTPLYVNPAIEEIMGISVEDAYTDESVWWRIVHEEDRDWVIDEIEKAYKEKRKYSLDYRIRLPRNEEVRWLKGQGWVIRDEQGHPYRMAEISLDITEQKQLESSLRESQEKFKVLAETAEDAILMMDSKGCISYWNNAAAKLYGYEREEVLGRNLHRLLVPLRYRRASQQGLATFRKTGEGAAIGKTLELTACRKGGEEFPVELSLGKANIKGEWVAVGIIRDISKRKRLMEELVKSKESAEAANEQKSRYLAYISHDIRTPLSAVTGMADIAMHKGPSDEVANSLEKIRSSADSLLLLLNDILDMSRIEAGGLEIETVEFDLQETMERLVDIFGIRCQEKNLEMMLSIHQEVPLHLMGDPLRLGQVLVNLVGNAVKFTDTGSITVHVCLVKRDESRAVVAFKVKDTGIGITPEQATDLFKPFVQATKSTTRQFGGSGLGLAICKVLVEKMGGEIQLESEAGKGSTFSFTAAFGLVPETQERLERPCPGLEGRRGLIADDNRMVREVLSETLSVWGMRTKTVDSGKRALEELAEAVSTAPYDLVVLDWRMPNLDGLETVLRIRGDHALQDNQPKIILVTAMDRQDTKQHVAGKGVDAVLYKPVKPSQLRQTVTALLRVESTKTALAASAKFLDGVSILVVDDSPVIREVMISMLSDSGVSVLEATTGEEALGIAAKERIDLVLMDVRLPDMDGRDVSRQIKSEPKNSKVPVLAMTAEDSPEERAKTVSAGMEGHLVKPVRQHELFAALKQWLRPKNGSEIDPAQIVEPVSSEGRDSIENPPGLHVDVVLRQCGGDATQAKKIIRLFARSYKESAVKMAEAIGSGRGEEALSLAHELKGAAAAAGAMEVSEKAALLETALKKGQDKLLANHLEAFKTALGIAIESAGQLEVEGEVRIGGDKTGAGPASATTVAALVVELNFLLQAGSADAEECMHKLREALRGEHVSALDSLQERLDIFDFDGAGKCLAEIARALAIPLEEKK